MVRTPASQLLCPILLAALAGTALAIQPADSQTAPLSSPPPQQTPNTGRPTLPSQPMGGLVTDASTKPKGTPNDKNKNADDKAKVSVSDQMTVDMSVKDENISAVLELLAVQSRKNIIASKSVSGKVSADLFGVTFNEALDAILNVNGFAYRQQGNFIYVYTTAELEQINKALKPRVAKVFKLNYLTAPDASEFVKPMLSQGGEIKHNKKTENFAIADSAPAGKDDFALSATLVVIDYEENIKAVEALLTELDTKPSQVLVEATVLSASVQEDNALGVDFSIIGDLNFGDFATTALGGPFGIVDSLRKQPSAVGRGVANSSDVGGTGTAGGYKIGIVQDNVAVFVRALDAVTNTTVLANPKIMTLNRQVSRVLVGQRVGYLSTTATETSSTQTVQFLDTGVQLYVRPFVNAAKNEIRMELRPQFSKANPKNVPGANGAQIIIPDEDTQEISTNVIVPDGMTVVLGGLFREDVVSGRQQVPFLGDVPLIGAAFRGQTDTTKRSEIIFLLTPRIVTDSAMGTLGDRAADQVDRVRAGTRQGLLPFSRDRMTAALNMEAAEAARTGDTQRAMWLIGQSLSLDSNQAEVYRLREKLTGTREVWPNRSLFEDVIDKDVTDRLNALPGGVKLGDPNFRSIKIPTQPSREFPPGKKTSDASGTGPASSAAKSWQAFTQQAQAQQNGTPQGQQSIASKGPTQSGQSPSQAGPLSPAQLLSAAGKTFGKAQNLPTPMQIEPCDPEENGSILAGAGDQPSGTPAEQPK